MPASSLAYFLLLFLCFSSFILSSSPSPSPPFPSFVPLDSPFCNSPFLDFKSIFYPSCCNGKSPTNITVSADWPFLRVRCQSERKESLSVWLLPLHGNMLEWSGTLWQRVARLRTRTHTRPLVKWHTGVFFCFISPVNPQPSASSWFKGLISNAVKPYWPATLH